MRSVVGQTECHKYLRLREEYAHTPDDDDESMCVPSQVNRCRRPQSFNVGLFVCCNLAINSPRDSLLLMNAYRRRAKQPRWPMKCQIGVFPTNFSSAVPRIVLLAPLASGSPAN
jgi:hypothetical protein